MSAAAKGIVMSSDKLLEVVPKVNSVAPICFTISAFAFLASLLGLIVNQWLSGWMATGGMAGIALFYLALGLISLGSRIPVYGPGLVTFISDDPRGAPADAGDTQAMVNPVPHHKRADRLTEDVAGSFVPSREAYYGKVTNTDAEAASAKFVSDLQAHL